MSVSADSEPFGHQLHATYAANRPDDLLKRAVVAHLDSDVCRTAMLQEARKGSCSYVVQGTDVPEIVARFRPGIPTFAPFVHNGLRIAQGSTSPMLFYVQWDELY